MQFPIVLILLLPVAALGFVLVGWLARGRSFNKQANGRFAFLMALEKLLWAHKEAPDVETKDLVDWSEWPHKEQVADDIPVQARPEPAPSARPAVKGKKVLRRSNTKSTRKR